MIKKRPGSLTGRRKSQDRLLKIMIWEYRDN